MSNFEDELEEWLKERRARAASQQSHEETSQRFDRLEGSISELTTTFKDFVKRSSPGEPPHGGGDGGDGGDPVGDAGAPPPPPDPPPPDIPIERVSLGDVPRIYTGDDEPETVTYLDAETGEEKTRPGRRKGQPTRAQIEVVPAGDNE